MRRNALIADLLHRIAFIERAGTGIFRMREDAQSGGYPEPIFEVNGFFTAIFRPLPSQEEQATGEVAEQVGTKSALSRHQVEILDQCRKEQTLIELMTMTGRSDRTKFRNQVLTPLMKEGLIEMTIPDKPRSSKQRYRITPLGREVLQQEQEEQ